MKLKEIQEMIKEELANLLKEDADEVSVDVDTEEGDISPFCNACTIPINLCCDFDFDGITLISLSF